MAVELATAYVSIAASAKGIASSIQSELGDPLAKAGDKAGDESASKFGSAFKSGIGKAAKAAAIGFGAAFVGAVAIGKQSIDAASDLDESMSKVNVVFGDASKGVIDWSKSSATAFGQSQQSALEAAGTYGNLFQAFGLQQKPAQEMSQSLVELAADLASFNNTSVDEALQALQSGVSGETEPLKRYGVAINDVRLKEEALALGLISSTKDALTPAAKAQASYSLIMKDTALAQGDFSRTSDGLANKQRIMSAQWKNAQAAIGRALLPALTAVVSFMAEKFIPAVQRIAEEWMPRLIAGVKTAAQFFKTQVIPVFVAVASAIQSTFQWLLDHQPVLIGILVALGVAVVALFTSWAISAGAAAVATIAATAPFIAIGVAIAAVVAGVIYAYQNWELFRTVVDGVRAWMVDTLWPAIQAVFGWLRDNVPPIMQAVASFFADVVWPAMQKVWDFVVTYLWPAFQAYADFLITFWKTAFETAVTVVTTLWTWLQTLWDRSEGLRNFLASAFVVAVGVVSTAIGVVSTAVETLWGWWQTLWDRTEGLRAFLAGAFWLAVTTIGTAFDAISTAVSTVWSWFQTVWDKGVEVADFFAGAFDLAVGGLEDAFGLLKDAISGVRDAIQWVIDKANAALGPLKTVVDLANKLPGLGGGVGVPEGWLPEGTGARANGGPVHAGQAYIVGEKRPELFVPEVNGTIIPRVPTGGDSVTINHYGESVTPATISAGLAMARMMR